MTHWHNDDPLDASHDTLVIDPVKMNIVNRIAEGSAVDGDLRFDGGLLLQGTLRGMGEITGRLVIWHTGQLQGRFKVLGDLYVLGHLGGVADDIDRDTLIECQGTAYVASTGVSTGTLLAARLRMYDGAVLQGPFKTLRPEQSVPVLQAARNS
ncbi:MAG: cell shape determination protein CcmA [Burkholderiales bacterium PBB6]|jgi:cytoskeletal protein CcmA (bactofilin family)|nr:MAG: cell shape determination protein CcmA [Burkholderiales bacterium PBB6]